MRLPQRYKDRHAISSNKFCPHPFRPQSLHACTGLRQQLPASHEFEPVIPDEGARLMDADRQQQLFERYPQIFQERSLPVAESGMGRGIETGNGWFHLIDTLCARLQRETDLDRAPQVIATQIKEKLGGLCFYSSNTNTERQQAMIDLACALSRCICDVCGAPGSLLSLDQRCTNFRPAFLATRCPAHAVRRHLL